MMEQISFRNYLMSNSRQTVCKLQNNKKYTKMKNQVRFDSML